MPRRLPVLLILLLAFGLHADAQPPAAVGLSLAEVLASVGAAVERFYARAQRLMCVEGVVLQPLRYDLSPDGSLPRHLEFERRVTWDASADGAAAEATVRRELLRVNRRAPRPKDKPQCFDPAEADPDPMQLLLPANRDNYTFTLAGVGRTDKHPALMLDFREKGEGPVTMRRKEGVEDCFLIDIPGRSRGRVWIDPDNFDVLRIDERLSGPVDIRGRARELKTRSDFESTLMRHEVSTVYRAVSFAGPDETLIMPASVMTLYVSTNSRWRETRTFTNYRRFVTDGRMVQEP